MKVRVSLTLAACYAASSTAAVVVAAAVAVVVEAARHESLEESADDPTHRATTSTLETTMFLPERHDGETSSHNALLDLISRISEMWHRSLVSSGMLRSKKSTSASTITRFTLAEPRAAPAQPMPVVAAPVAHPVPVMQPKVPAAVPVLVPYPSRPNPIDFILQSDAPSKTPSTAPTVGDTPVAPSAHVGGARAATKVPSQSPLDPANTSTLDSDAPSRTPSIAPTRDSNPAPLAAAGRGKGDPKFPSQSPRHPTIESTLESDAPSNTPSKAPALGKNPAAPSVPLLRQTMEPTSKNQTLPPIHKGPDAKPGDPIVPCPSWPCSGRKGNWMHGGNPCKKLCVLPDDRTYYTSRGWTCGLCPMKY